MAQAQDHLFASQKGSSEWSIPGDGSTIEDPLLDCLVVLTRIYGRPHTPDALRAGLPLQNGCLTAELFIRAAARAELSCRLLKASLDQISSLVTPVVLLLKGRNAAILKHIDHRTGKAQIVSSKSGDGVTDIKIKQLEAEYEGHCFFIKPKYRYDQRTTETLKLHSQHWFWGTVTLSWRIYRDVLVASLLINLFAVVSPLFVMNVYDRVVPNNAIPTLWVLAVGAIIAFTFDFVLKLTRSYFIDIAGKKSDILLSAMIMERVLGLEMKAKPVSVGAFARNLQEFDSIREFITSSSITALVDLPFVIILLLVIYLIGGPMVVAPLVGILLIAGFGFLVQTPLRDSIEQTMRTSAQKNATLIESLSGIEALKIARAESEVQSRWEKAVGHIAHWGVKSKMLTNSAGSVAAYIQQITTVCLVIMGVYLITAGELSMGGMIASVMLAGRCLAPMAQVASLSTRYNQARSAFASLNQVMEMEVERPEGKRFVSRPKLTGNIDFDNVSFSYPGQQIATLAGINLKINAGEKVGIIGRIGSGKSTLMRLMLGLYHPDQGAVRADGVDLRQINPSDLRRNIGCVTQDVTLFYGTVRDNIMLGASHSEDSAVLRAAQQAGVTEFADRHPDGLDMLVGERGQNLSGGQRQSVALARALLLDPGLLFMDEPTSAMDHTSEVRMRSHIKDHCRDKTLVLCTHKASMLELVERLIVVDHGRIVADGPKEQVHEALRQGKLKIST